MSITYEEALETLEGMFGAPWERKTLDAVLRYHQGHMENTVDSILRHGEGTPETLIAQLKSGTVPQDQNTAMDEQLARQLSQQPQSRSRRAPNATATGAASSSATSSAVPAKKGRGTPTELPTDFLRIPGYQGTGGGGMDADEALARMLQDELFTQELANNPEFAHLARGRPRTSGGQPIRGGAGGRNVNRVGELPSRTAGAPRRNLPGEEAPNIVEKLTELGGTAKKRLQLLAAQFQANNRFRKDQPANSPTGRAERRGLLDDGEEEEHELVFEMSEKKND